MLRPTRAASSVTVRRPSYWSAARILRSTASMKQIPPLASIQAGRLRNTFWLAGDSFSLSAYFEGESSMAASSIAAFWVVALLLIIVPGADWAFTISAGLRGHSIPAAVSGLVLGYAAMTIVVAAGVGALLARSPAFLTGLTIAGGLYLMWHGARALARPSAPGTPSGAPASTNRATLVKGVGVSGLNPKGLLVFLALLPQFTNPHRGLPLPVPLGVLGLAFTLP